MPSVTASPPAKPQQPWEHPLKARFELPLVTTVLQKASPEQPWPQQLQQHCCTVGCSGTAVTWLFLSNEVGVKPLQSTGDVTHRILEALILQKPECSTPCENPSAHCNALPWMMARATTGYGGLAGLQPLPNLRWPCLECSPSKLSCHGKGTERHQTTAAEKFTKTARLGLGSRWQAWPGSGGPGAVWFHTELQYQLDWKRPQQSLSPAYV